MVTDIFHNTTQIPFKNQAMLEGFQKNTFGVDDLARQTKLRQVFNSLPTHKLMAQELSWLLAWSDLCRSMSKLTLELYGMEESKERVIT